MLKHAFYYADQLKELQRTVVENEDYYKYLISTYYRDLNNALIDLDDLKNEEFCISRVSVVNEKVLGFMRAGVTYDMNIVHAIMMLSFENDRPNPVFLRDLESFIHYLLGFRKFNKINFTVYVGNPAEKIYKRFISKYNGRLVGTLSQDAKLRDGTLVDINLYELMREDYENSLTK